MYSSIEVQKMARYSLLKVHIKHLNPGYFQKSVFFLRETKQNQSWLVSHGMVSCLASTCPALPSLPFSLSLSSLIMWGHTIGSGTQLSSFKNTKLDPRYYSVKLLSVQGCKYKLQVVYNLLFNHVGLRKVVVGWRLTKCSPYDNICLSSFRMTSESQ